MNWKNIRDAIIGITLGIIGGFILVELIEWYYAKKGMRLR
jgi:hypothetical protein